MAIATSSRIWNKIAEPSGLRGNFPFPTGAVLAKESFETQDGKPGPQGPLFIMEKRGEGYDRAHANWYYAVVDPSGTVSLSGSGHERSNDAILLSLPCDGEGQRLCIRRRDDHEGQTDGVIALTSRIGSGLSQPGRSSR
jgi:hypothetical protein